MLRALDLEMEDAEFKLRSVHAIAHASSRNCCDNEGGDLSQGHMASWGRAEIKLIYFRKSLTFRHPLKH